MLTRFLRSTRPVFISSSPAICRRHLSAAEVCLDIDLSECKGASLEVEAIGSQEEALVINHPSLRVEHTNNKITVRPTQNEESKHLKISVPRRLAEARLVASGEVRVSGKLEISGNIKIHSRENSIQIDILRAATLDLEACEKIEAFTLVEGQEILLNAAEKSINIHGKLQANRCNAITRENVYIKSAYCSSLLLNVAKSVNILTMHGIIKSETRSEEIKVASLTGSASIQAQSITINLDSALDNSDFTAHAGDIFLRTSSEQDIRFELEASDTLHVPPELIITQSDPNRILGHLDSKSQHTVSATTGAGKINATAKNAQRWGGKLSSHSLPTSSSQSEPEGKIPTLLLQATASKGSITLLSPLSWIDRIRHNFGFAPLDDETRTPSSASSPAAGG